MIMELNLLQICIVEDHAKRSRTVGGLHPSSSWKENSNSIEILSTKQRYPNSLVHMVILTYVIRNPWEELQDVRVRREQYSLS